MWIERPVAADFAFQTQLLAVSGQNQFNRGSIEPDAVVERLHLVLLINSAHGQHRHQDVDIGDMARIAGK